MPFRSGAIRICRPLFNGNGIEAPVKLLEGKRALVTGIANRWSIATGIARKFHDYGASLALTYQGERVREEVEKLATELGGSIVVECDVSSDASLSAMRDVLAERCGKFDAVVHSIAFANKEDLGGRVYDTSRSGYGLSLDISAYSLVALARTLRERLNDGASIVALTYLGATKIVPNYNLMGIAKAALEAGMRYLAYDLGDRGIRVNAISAGPIKTASMRQVSGATRMLEIVPKVAPLRRNVTPEDIGNAAVYLASDLSNAVTADVHFVDAGYHAMGMYPPDFTL
ncbi:MAG: enoyl-ACP reductase [Candidatus Eremiobacteraeota bacterium]|nr:enoyl-ACP reductase [Candidatus Eremiobacteraeota bacterium]